MVWIGESKVVVFCAALYVIIIIEKLTIYIVKTVAALFVLYKAA